MLGSYGSLLTPGQDTPWIRQLFNAVGYSRFFVTPDQVTLQWVRTGYSFERLPLSIESAQRDWRESWFGRPYPSDSPSSVAVSMPPTDVDGVRTLDGAQVQELFQPPAGTDYYAQPDPPRPEDYTDTVIPLESFPKAIAVVDTVPELLYEVSFDI
jgi:hypothetical protein